ncbi:hypothetical protein BDN70DRAFT_886823 [Pholiota conissans]|uniref:Uncharacterized protein n=1 Tax=Pholiota conissans TaxID=109636 RepID=A0A9P6CTZ6_9AGAR|nr:hypothetical protein BDN70DRAFT_886823 [Pholiota conissans]
MSDQTTNALGLDFSELSVSEPGLPHSEEVPEAPTAAPGTTEASTSATTKKEKTKPYVNPERVRTGGAQRDKLSDEALEERMVRIREQNEKIKQRRLDVQADEDAFRKTQEVERAKQAHNRKVQSEIDRARDQNAKRKMDKVQNREWDSGKPSVGENRQQPQRSDPSAQQSDVHPSESAPSAPSEPSPPPEQPAVQDPTVDWANTPSNDSWTALMNNPPVLSEPLRDASGSGNWAHNDFPSGNRGRERGRGRGRGDRGGFDRGGRGRGSRGSRGRGGDRRESAEPRTSSLEETEYIPTSW